MARPALDYLILDAVADDVESLVHIRDGVADSASSESNLIGALRRLVQEHLIEAYTISGAKAELVSAGQGVWPPVSAEDLWFQITGRGRWSMKLGRAVLKEPPSKRLKLAARVDWGMNLSSARRSLSAIR